MTAPTERQIAAAEKTAAGYRAIVAVMAEFTSEMMAADVEARALCIKGSCLDIIAEQHFPAWGLGRNGAPGMGRKQWSAVRLPDPDAENGTIIPFGGFLK